jgi:hypothetical protein
MLTLEPDSSLLCHVVRVDIGLYTTKGIPTAGKFWVYLHPNLFHVAAPYWVANISVFGSGFGSINPTAEKL